MQTIFHLPLSLGVLVDLFLHKMILQLKLLYLCYRLLELRGEGMALVTGVTDL